MSEPRKTKTIKGVEYGGTNANDQALAAVAKMSPSSILSSCQTMSQGRNPSSTR